jgi:hypothetical protein
VSTNREVITDALIELSVLDANETANSEDAALCLRVMNRMFALLAADGIDLGYPPQDSLTDAFPLDDTVQAQIHYLLAATLRSSFPSVQPDPTLFALAGAARGQLLRAAVIANREESSVTHAPLGERSAWRYNILTD